MSVSRATDREAGVWPLRALITLVAVLLLARLLGLGSYALMDTSEARYGEIARVMVQTADWVTPQEVPGTPFWAKPPLSTWLSAAAIQLFGVSEFSLRFPAWLCALAVIAMAGVWAAELGAGAARTRAWLARACLASSAGFFAAAGAVMTDPALVVCTAAMQLAFHQAVIRGRTSVGWRYGFFMAAGLGMLAKGPVIAVFVGAPLFIWALWSRRVAVTWHALPWLSGAALAALICVPWYVLAEVHTPGFLSYFLLGEHVMRFIKPGWGGDLYGTAHAEATGTIWLYLLGALGAQVVLLGIAVRAQWQAAKVPAGAAAGDSQRLGLRFAACNALFPIAFFTFAGNIIWTYVLPSLPALAVLLAYGLERAGHTQRRLPAVVLACLGLNAVLLLAAFSFWVPAHVSKHSSRDLVADVRVQSALQEAPVWYLGRKAPASLRFYARGRVVAVPDESELIRRLNDAARSVVAVSAEDAGMLAQRWAQHDPAWQIRALVENSDLTLIEVRRQ